MGAAVTLFKGFVYVIGFGSIIFLTYITTKFIGSRANKVTKGKYISMVDTITVGLNKQIHLVKVGDQFVLISSSGKNIEFLAHVAMDDVEVEQKSVNSGAFDFKNMLEKYFQTLKSRKNNKSEDSDNGWSKKDLDVPSESSFKNNLNKLSAITSRLNKSVNGYGDEKADEK